MDQVSCIFKSLTCAGDTGPEFYEYFYSPFNKECVLGGTELFW